MRKTVVELDLVGYSTVARLLEEAAGPQSVAALNDQIQKFIDQGLQAVELPRQKTVIKTTGDGAILVFDRASDAHTFAATVHDCTQIHNAQRSDPLTKRWFRIGIATGEIAMQTLDHGGYEIAGTTVAIAVRLETACRPGAILIDRSTFELLNAPQQGLYGQEEAIAGKRDERFHGRRCTIAPEADPTASDPAVPGVLKQMADAARPITQQFVRRVTSHGIFNPDVYGERHDVRLHLATFLEGTHAGMFLFGTSGVGKTCFVAARATEWLLNLSSENLVLAFAAETLSASVPELESTLVRGLGLKPPFGEAIREVQAASSEGGSLRVLIILDGLERHPQPQRMIDAVLGLADSLREASAFRLLATCSLSVFQVRDREARLKTKDLFYIPQRGLLVDEDDAVPGIVLGGLTSDELESIYERYRSQPNTQPTTPFELLSEETRQMLSHPVLLRMAMEVFDSRDVPAGLFSGAMLQEFAAQKIMSSPRKSAVIAQVVDLMMAQRRRALPLSLLWDEFRPAPQEWEQWNQVLLELVDDQVLVLTSRDVFPGLPLPPELSIEFTFERLFEYLIAWRLISRHEDLQEIVQRGLAQGPHLGTVRGAIVFLLVHLIRISAIDEIRAIYQHASETGIDQLLHDALVELLVGMGTTEDESSDFPRLLTELFETHPVRTERLLSQVGETLFVRGSWDAAHDVVRLAARLSFQDAVAATRMRNRLVLLCKNMDRWPEALHESDQCLATAESEVDPHLSCRIYVNRGSVLYDLGKRAEAAEIFETAIRWAEKGEYPQGFATAANNLGLYYLYHDELARAEEMFQKASTQAIDSGLISAYILNNLGLVKWTRGLTVPAEWEEAEQSFDQALTRFRNAGHVQGMSYALSNRGVCELSRGRLIQAEEAFRKTREMAQRLGEKWTAYGATANLALVQLAQPVPKYDETLQLACDVRKSARENTDPKGIADASLVASRVALDWLAQSGAPASLQEETRTILEEARELFHDLGQRLGEAQACFGLSELAAICEQPIEAKHQEAAGRRLLRETELGNLSPRLIALPWHMLLLTELF